MMLSQLLKRCRGTTQAVLGAVIICTIGCDRPAARSATTRPTEEQIVAVRNLSRRTVRPAATEQPSDSRPAEMRETAAEALSRIGTPAIPALVKALSDPDPEVRAQAARALARIGPAARDAVPELMLALEDQDQYVRISAARALGQIGLDAAPAIPALIEALQEAPADSLPEPAPASRITDDTY